MTKREQSTEAKDYFIQKRLTPSLDPKLLRVDLHNPCTFYYPVDVNGYTVYVQIGITTKNLAGNAHHSPFDMEHDTITYEEQQSLKQA